MATAKRTSDITVALYEWNKLTTRNIAEDEKEYFNGGIEFVWEGKTPEIADGRIVEGEVKQWAKYDKQDSIRVTFENGEVYYTHSSNVTLYNK